MKRGFDPFNRPWRVGRKLQRTIYAMAADTPGDTDLLLGMMDSPAVAAHVVSLHNAQVIR